MLGFLPLIARIAKAPKGLGDGGERIPSGLRSGFFRRHRKKLLGVGFLAGVALAATIITGAKLTLTQRSDPAGIVANSTAYYDTGATAYVQPPSMSYNGYRFAYWLLNGIRQTDDYGISVTSFNFPITGNSEAVAVYLPETKASGGDSVPDWYKNFYFGTNTISGSDDSDGDGRTLAQEYVLGSNPRIPDSASDGGTVEGGISRRRAEMLTLALPDNYVHFTQGSDPGGVVTGDSWVTNGSTVSTVNAPTDYNGYKFGGWTINGVRQVDANGMSLSQATFTVSEDTVAVAHYYPVGQVSGGDGVPDWYKYLYYGTTDIRGSSDSDADGRTLAQEYALGSNPDLPDSAADGGTVEGGISRRRAGMLTLALPETYVHFTQGSDPGGIVWADSWVTNGSAVSTANAPTDYNGYKFGGWTVNGVRQTNETGMAVSQATFTMSGDAVAVAHYYPAAQVSGGDGVPDWYKYLYYGTTDIRGSSDSDGDGRTLSQEYQMGANPLIPDSAADGGTVEGGISRRRAEVLTINFQDVGVVPPVITLLGSNPLSVYQNALFTDPGATVTDEVYASRSITSSDRIDTTLLGSQTLTYDATNPLGAVAQQVTRTVNVLANPLSLGGSAGGVLWTNTSGAGTLTVGPVTLTGNATLVFTNPASSIRSTDGITISGTNNLISLSGGYRNGTTNLLLSGINLSISEGATFAITGPAVGNGTLSIGQSYTNPGSILTLLTNDTSIYLTVSQDTNSLSQGLVAYYPLNGNAMDESGDGRNGINNAILANDEAGNANAAFVFNGSSSYVSVPLTVSETSYSACLWFRTTDPNCGLYSVGAGPFGNQGNDRHIYLNSGNLSARTWNDETIRTAGVNYADGNWHQVIHLYDVNGVGQRIFVDGILKASGSKMFSDFNWEDSIYVGYSSDAPDRFASGVIKDVRIYNRSLSPAEVAQVFLNEGGTLAPPSITLNVSSNSLSLGQGASFTDPGATVIDPVDGTNQITGVGSIDASTVGTYTLTYGYTNSLGTVATPVILTVNVLPRPVITLNGPNPLTINQGTSFTDPGATVGDSLDGTNQISGIGSVQTGTPGSYTVTYGFTNSQGISAVPVTLVVNVAPVDIPTPTPTPTPTPGPGSGSSLPSTTSPSGKLFTDISAEFPDLTHSSVQAQFDFDQDGKLDLLVWRDDGLHLLRKSDKRGYAYEDKTESSGLKGLGFLNCGDIDNDGWPDLICQSSDGSQIFVMRNQHDGTFQKVEITSLFSGDLANRRTGLSLADIDGDGKLDLVFGINPSWGGGAIAMIRNHAGEAGAPDTVFSGKSYLAVVPWNYPHLDLTDANNDGKIDFLILESNGNWPYDTHPEHPVHLYLNTGSSPADYENPDNGKSLAGFTEKQNCGLNNANEMSPMASFDIDCSGNMSLINGSSDWRWISNPHIYVNDGQGNYTQMASPIVAGSYYHHGITLFDADLDNRTDGVWTGLHNFSDLYPRMWRNEGNLQFSDVTSEWGITCGIFGWGNLGMGGWACDLDGDGAPEFQSSGGNGWGGGAYTTLYRNDASLLGKHFLKVKLVGGAKSPKDGHGARVVVNANGHRRAQTLIDNGGTLNSAILNFGLGTNTTADSVTVYWPSGNVSTLNSVSGDQMVTIQEQAPLPKNLLVNGGFEEPSVRQLANANNQSWFTFGPGYAVDYASLPLPGWNVPWGEIDMMRGSKVQIAPAEGEQFIDIDGRMPGAVQQNFSTIPGHHYRVVFDYAGYSPAGLNASVSGESGNTYWSGSYSAGTNNQWSEITCDFDATGNSAMVAFSSAWRANWACGVLIDNVRAYDIAEQIPNQTPPVITLNSSNPLSIYKDSTFTDPRATVTDTTDGVRQITGIGTVDTSTLGSYTLTYGYTNSVGTVASPITLTVNVVPAPIIIGGNTGISTYTNTSGSGTVKAGDVTLSGNATIVYTNPSATISSTGTVSITGTNNLISLPGGYLNGSTNVLLSGTTLAIDSSASVGVTGPAVGNGTLSIGQSYTNPGSILTLQTNETSVYWTVSQNTDPLSQGLVAWYPLQEDANDYSGNQNNAILQGNAIYSSNSLHIIGNASEGYQGGGFVRLPQYNKEFNHISLNIWVKDEQTPVFDEKYFGFGDMWGAHNCLWMGIGGSNIHVGYNDISNNYQQIGVEVPADILNKWHMISLVMTPDSLSGYLNGKLFGAISGNFVAPDTSSLNAIGSHYWWGGGGHSARLTANLKNAKIYDRALSADEIAQVYNSEVGLKPQSISFDQLLAVTYGDAPFALNATSTSGNPVTYTTSDTNLISISGTNVTILGVGTATLVASQAGNSNFLAATPVTNTLVIGKGSNVISPFNPIPIQHFSNGAVVSVTPPTASSGLPVSLSVISGPATISSNIVTFTGIGTVDLQADQDGNNNYQKADPVRTRFFVGEPAPAPGSGSNLTIDAFGTGTNQFELSFITIDNPGNSNDTTGYGGVPYSYRIGKYTISQNQIDAAVTNGLQNVTAGGWIGDQPAANVSWYEAAAYVNWLNTSKGYQPAYNLTWTNESWSMALWPTAPDANGNVAWTNGGTNLFRNANCVYFLPSENEWYKAAYYDLNKYNGSGGYWQYPTGSDNAPTVVGSGTNQETCVYDQSWATGPASVFQAGGVSPFGTMGQGGNVYQWMETTWNASNNGNQEIRVIRGGVYSYISDVLQSSYRLNYFSSNDSYGLGFRVASIDTRPAITLTSSNQLSVAFGSSFTLPTANVVDLVDGTNQVTASGTVDLTKLGSYTLTFSYTNSQGVVAVPIKQTVEIAPTITNGYSPFQYPGSIWSMVGSIYAMKDSVSGNQVWGNYQDSIGNTNGFLYDGSNYTSIHYPGSTYTRVDGMSNNQVWGTYQEPSGNWMGFLYDGSHYTSIQYPGSIWIMVDGVSGSVVWGRYRDSSSTGIHNFLFDGSKYSTIQFPGSYYTWVDGVSGTLVWGRSQDSYAKPHGFIYDGSNYTTIQYPGSTSSELYGVSDNQAWGTYQDSIGNTHGFICDGVNYTTIQFPGSTYSAIWFVSGNQVWGNYKDANGNWYGFRFDGRNYTTILYPGSISTTVHRLSGNKIWGYYKDSSGKWNNFLYDGNNYTAIQYPESTDSWLYQMSENLLWGWGNYQDTSGKWYDFLYYNSKYTSIEYPGSSGSVVTGVTGSQVYGNYQDFNGKLHGFLFNLPVIAKASNTIASFATIPDQTYNYGVAFNVTPPTASSGLPVDITVKSGPATVSGNTVTLTGVGTVILAANQVGNANYTAALEVSTSFSVTAGTQSITFPTIPSQTYGNGPVTLGATASSGLPVSYSSSSTNISISSNTVTILGVGTATITASQPGNGNWNEATPVDQNLVITKAGNVISSFTAIPSKAYSNGATFSISPPTASSGLPVDVTVKSGPATISGNTVTLTGSGMVTLAANQSGDANYDVANEVTTSFSVGAGSQSITFPSLGSKTFGASPFILGGSASSGLPLSYSSTASNLVSISGNVVTIVGAGTATIVASQSGDSNYLAATPVTNSLVIGKASNVITFGALGSRTYGSGTFSLGATASSGLNVSYSNLSSNLISISGTNVSILGVGTATIVASQSGNSNYQAAASVTNTLVIGKGSNVITFGALGSRTYGSGTISLGATASSGLNVSYSNLSSNLISISGSNVTMLGVGTATIVATQVGNSNYLAAASITNSLVIAKGSNVIGSFATIPTKTYYPGATMTITPPSASSGLPVTLSMVSGPGLLSGTTLSLTGTGTITIAANQAGNSNYATADQVTTSFEVISRQSQSITFGGLSPKTYGDSPFTLSAVASSGLPVNFSAASTNISISSNVVTILSSGTARIVASQAGDSNYLAASSITNSFVIAKASNVINAFAPISSVNYSAGAIITVSAPVASSGLPVALSVLSGPAMLSGTTLSLTGTGTVTLAANQAGNSNFVAAGQVTTSFVVNKGTQSITFPEISPKVYNDGAFSLSATASSGLPVSYNSPDTNVISITGNGVAILGVGTVSIVATQAGNVNWNEAPPVTNEVVIGGKATPIITISGTNATYDGTGKSVLVSTVPSGLSNTTTYTGSPYLPIIPGSYSVVTTVADGFYEGSATATLTISKASNTISFPALNAISYSNGLTIKLTATSSSTLPVSFWTPDASLVSLSGSNATILGTGTATIVALQSGNSYYKSATPVTNSLVIVGKASNQIAFPPLATISFGMGVTTNISASASSGLPVTFTTQDTNVISISGNTVSLLGAGAARIVASQSGGSAYLAADPITNTLVVSKASNVIGTFPAIPTQTYSNGATFSVNPPSASSGLPVTLSVLSGPATIVSNTVTLLGAGSVILAADQSGNTNYQAATRVTTGLAVVAGSQSITFPAIPTQTYGDSPFMLTATASSRLPVTYSTPDGLISLTSSNMVRIQGAGTTTIVASQSGDSNWVPAASVTNTVVIRRMKTMIFPFAPIPPQTYTSGSTLTIVPPDSSSGLPVVVSVKSGPATISGNTIRFTGAGTVELAGNQPGDANHEPALEVGTSFGVGAGDPGLALPGLPVLKEGDLPLTLAATSLSGAPIHYASSDTNVAIITENPVADVSTDLGAFVMELLTSNAPATVRNFLSYSNDYGSTFVDRSVPGSFFRSGGYHADDVFSPVSLHEAASSESSVAAVRGTVSMLAGIAGSQWSVNLADRGTNDPGTVFARVLGKGMEVADRIAALPVFDAGAPLDAVPLTGVTNGQSVFTTNNLVNCGVTMVPGPVLTVVGAGSVTITVSQDAGNGWTASSVSRNLTVGAAASRAQSITPFAPIATKTAGAGTFAIQLPYSDSGLPVLVSVKSGPATISGNMVSVTGSGTVTLAANQPGNASYLPAPEVTTSFLVSGTKAQTISFSKVTAKPFGSPAIALKATASSKLPVSFGSSDTSIARIQGDQLLIQGAGTVTLTATQSGDGTYQAAAPVTQTIVIAKGVQKIAAFAGLPSPIFAPGATVTLNPPASSSGLPVVLGVKSGPATISGNTLTLTGAGKVTLTASQQGNSNYLPAATINGTLTVQKGAQTITFPSPGNQPYVKGATFQLSASASSGDVVSYASSASSVISVKGNIATIKGQGSAVITATQKGNVNYAAALPIIVIISVQ